jgi:hypothetical protein
MGPVFPHKSTHVPIDLGQDDCPNAGCPGLDGGYASAQARTGRCKTFSPLLCIHARQSMKRNQLDECHNATAGFHCQALLSPDLCGVGFYGVRRHRLPRAPPPRPQHRRQWCCRRRPQCRTSPERLHLLCLRRQDQLSLWMSPPCHLILHHSLPRSPLRPRSPLYPRRTLQPPRTSLRRPHLKRLQPQRRSMHRLQRRLRRRPRPRSLPRLRRRLWRRPHPRSLPRLRRRLWRRPHPRSLPRLRRRLWRRPHPGLHLSLPVPKWVTSAR